MVVLKVILKRFFEKFGLYFIKLIIGPIMLWVFVSLLMILVSYVECWALGSAWYTVRGFTWARHWMACQPN